MNPPFCDRFLGLAPRLSQYRFLVATTQDVFREKTCFALIFALPLHRQSEQKQFQSDTKRK